MIKLILKNRRLLLLTIFLLIIIESLLIIPLPYISRFFIDVVIGQGKYELTSMIFSIFAMLLITQLVVGSILARNIATFEASLVPELQERVIEFSFQKKWLDTETRSRVQEIILNDIEMYSTNLTNVYYTILSNVLKIIGCTVVLLSINFQLGIICLAFVPIYLMWISYVSNRLKKITFLLKHSREQIIQSTNNILYNLLPIKIYDLLQVTFNPYRDNITRNSSLIKRVKIYSNFITIVSNLIITTATFLPLFIGVNLIKESVMTIGDLIAFNGYIGMLFSPITALISTITIIKTNSVYKERINPFLSYNTDSIKKIPKQEPPFVLKVQDFSIEVKKIRLLENISFLVSSGEVVQIIGEKCTGKTLFLKSLINLTDFSGSVLLNNIEVKYNSAEQLNNSIVYVANDIDFVEGGVYDNIPPTDFTPKVFDAVGLRKRLSEFENLKEIKMEYLLKEFSSGEIQKLKIARALNKKPNVLLMDEMFSHISKYDSDLIMHNILHLFPNSIVIIVEHHYHSELITSKYKIENSRFIKII